ncbi:Piso0_004479 [Millerozyma farinosa CBS 7064]|uniref:Piso0_004479 protein n=1 Tax=Pichia sorbitophila (strain ATCC MYA-4447 / BCRC 22081 / CBS 7064 / NBRC 10061 / NRRL Y-12695) TaxID=559304 RepID=G8Y5K3_PICSO|nr:Piso0_004479 [Millerozyma farinosa CBS 7064]CCE84914.1 Piso0_004479 [Millerozyma farinosa CBS 7064]
MARPSINSQLLIDFANSKQSQRPSDRASSLSSASDSEEKAEQHKTLLSQEQARQAKKDQYYNIELIRKKYALQNQSLAKNNSLMMSRVSEMEAKISDLINENMKLRKSKAFQETEMKSYLETALQTIENGVIGKFAEIAQLFSGIRANEGLSTNPSMEFFQRILEFDPQVTSTPTHNPKGYEDAGSPFSQTARSASNFSKADTFVLPETHDSLKAKPEVNKKSNDPNNLENEARDRRDSIDSVHLGSSPRPTLDIPQARKVPKTPEMEPKDKETEPVVLPQHKNHMLLSSPQQNEHQGFMVYQDEQANVHEKPEDPSKPTKKPGRKGKVGRPRTKKITEPKESAETRSSGKEKDSTGLRPSFISDPTNTKVNEAPQAKEVKPSNKANDKLQNPAKNDSEGEANDVHAKLTMGNTEATKPAPPKESSINSQDSKAGSQETFSRESSAEGTGRRPTRNRKTVSYKWPSLSKKLRRPSEKLADAVITDEQQNEMSIKREDDSGELEAKKEDASEPKPKKQKRNPLTNVTNVANTNTNHKSSKTQNESSLKDTTEFARTKTNDHHGKENTEPEANEADPLSVFDFPEIKPTRKYRKEKHSVF